MGRVTHIARTLSHRCKGSSRPLEWHEWLDTQTEVELRWSESTAWPLVRITAPATGGPADAAGHLAERLLRRNARPRPAAQATAPMAGLDAEQRITLTLPVDPSGSDLEWETILQGLLEEIHTLGLATPDISPGLEDPGRLA